jgi:tight adherence protein C
MEFLQNNMMLIIGVSVFGLIAAAVYALSEYFAPVNSRAEDRLDGIRDPLRKGADGHRKGGALSRMLDAASPAWAKPMQPANVIGGRVGGQYTQGSGLVTRQPPLSPG